MLARLGRDDVEGSPSHPQFGLARLVRRLGFDDHREVPVLGAVPPDLRARERAIAEAMRPAFATEVWASLATADRDEFAAGLADVALLVAANEQEEALAIAGLLRETLDTPGASAALVTPDRTLARRVATELKRFGLDVDDSAGVPLSETPAGLFARLVVEAARAAASPATLVPLLKHPLATFGLEPVLARRAAAALERLALRGPAPPPGVAGLVEAATKRAALRQKADARESAAARDLTATELAAALDLAERVAARLGPLEAALALVERTSFQSLVGLHADTLARLAETPDRVPTRPEDGLLDLDLYLAEAADESVGARAKAPREYTQHIQAQYRGRLAIAPRDYPELFLALMRGRPARGRPRAEERVRVYGLMEARLVRHDRLVLGGLVEGVWPSATTTDPWLSRTMRTAVGLPVPERRIGLSAHDLAQALGTRDVWMTRSDKRDGAPTVPSRWLSRLEAVLGRERFAALADRGAARLAATRAIDRGPVVGRIARPEPKPPVGARPRALSVTEIETLVRDPYSIYARHVLKLRPFEAIGEEPGAAEKGSLFHAALERFAKEIDDGQPIDPVRLIAHAETAFAELAAPDLLAFWRPRFARIAHAIADFERRRRASGPRVRTEIAGRLVWSAWTGPFTLAGRADRVEIAPDGTLAIIDYKTGQPPSSKEIAAGFSPQLPLEAAMAKAGGFLEAGVPAGGTVGELLHVRLSGGDPAIVERQAERKGTPSAEAMADAALLELKGLIDAFENVEMPYKALRHPKYKLRFGVYDHLARVAEWGFGDDEADADAGGSEP